MMRVADMSKIEAIVDVGENDIPKVHLGDTAQVSVDAYSNRKFKGYVTQIASSVTNAAGVATTTVSTNDVTNYKVHIRLFADSYHDLIDPKRPKSFPFRPGMSATADIQTNTHFNVLAVPINAVAVREKGTDNAVLGNSDESGNDNKNDTRVSNANSQDLDEVVFLRQPGDSVRKVRVRTDIQDINYIEVVDGIKEGDEVITGPYSVVSRTLKGGTRVKVVPKDQLFEAKKN
jgi:HlyD family secretion protein